MNNPYYLKDTRGDYYNKYPEFQIWEEGRLAGIKEVVGEVEMAHGIELNDDKCNVLTITKTWWQSKLRDWGIE